MNPVVDDVVAAFGRVAVHPRYVSSLYGPTPITPALLRLDPIWDPLRTDPAFQKLIENEIDSNASVYAHFAEA